MTILDELLARLPQENVPVRHVLVGAHWTVVCSRHAGMAATLMADKPHGHSRVREVGRLEQKPAQALAELARSKDPLEVSIGVAAINSLIDVDENSVHELNAAEVLAQRGRDRTVALVGHFPFIQELRSAVGE
ncbi:MAG TPA: DUF4213 domain-containing protein, partial [Anaerolineales bacterium]|nr:DUF4213 domain-containing protein [Anaerolineales bacterium]